MAYMSQERKAKIAPVVKAICAKHGVKATLAVRHHSTLVLTISEGAIDFFADRVPVEGRPCPEHLREYAVREFARAAEEGCLDVSPHGYRERFRGAALAFLVEVIPAMNEGNHDRSEPMTDYFDVGWYIDINIGRPKKPYRLVERKVGPYRAPESATASYRARATSFASYVAERETEESLAAAKAERERETLTIPEALFWQRAARA